MTWHKVVTYTPYEYRQEMKRRGKIMVIFAIFFIVAVIGFEYWYSNQIQSTNNKIQSMSWGFSGFTVNNSQPILISGVVCNGTGFYLEANANKGSIQAIFLTPINGSNVDEKGDFNIISKNSFSIYSLPYITCNNGQKYWTNVTVVDKLGVSYLKVNGTVRGVGDACQFSQGSISCT